MSIAPITIPMSIESNEVTIDSTFDARIEVVEGGSITVESLSVNTNGTTTAPTGKAYSPVVVNVPNSYTNADEGKVVKNGALTSQTTTTKNANGTYDTTTIKQVTVSVPASAVDTGTKNITSNGNNQDVVGYAAVNVAVPNSYSAADEGKVVSSGALVSQTSETYTDNGTYDTTLKNSVTVAIPTQGAQTIHPSSSDQTIASGKYLTGTQTIKGVTTTNLTAANIKKDVVIEIGDSTDSDCVTSVTGTYEGGGGGTPTVTALSAVYTQSGTVDETDDLSVLIPDLVVTATISNSLTVEVASTDYTLSGTLSQGTSTVTVSYAGLTTTFSVTVTKEWDFYWDYTMGELPTGWTFETSSSGSYQLTSDGIELLSGNTTSSYARMTYNNVTNEGEIAIEFSGDKTSSRNGMRLSISDGTNGAHICTPDGYFRLLTSTSYNTNSPRLAVFETGKTYKVSLKYQTSGNYRSYTINGVDILKNDTTSVQYGTTTRIYSQADNNTTILIKRIWYKGV